MNHKKTIILGATTEPGRYANLAANRLVKLGYTIVNVGLKSGDVAGVNIEKPEIIHNDIDTISLYINPLNQATLYDYILLTNPKRIIFNPGAENPVLELLARKRGIQTEIACTLVLLNTGQY
ncbi:CoA-binding protein [Mucilaginibacter defluvii]|uniref:CoA-binding protein n=1 Tax=Mucilaginibacter defluvii TaxID=1196019 RepID=A0ABP9FWJ3_9SPHI